MVGRHGSVLMNLGVYETNSRGQYLLQNSSMLIRRTEYENDLTSQGVLSHRASVHIGDEGPTSFAG